jgi:hypothetical protein
VLTVRQPLSLVALMIFAVFAAGCERQSLELGFWFEDVSFESPVLGGRLTLTDLQNIEQVARAELDSAFQGLTLRLSDSRRTPYRVRVVQEVFAPTMNRKSAVAGETRGLPGLGGLGAVNFSYFAAGAIVYAPPGATRGEIVAGIGRGLGRGAVHEFAHQLVKRVELHATRDRGSYEYDAASRVEQYYGLMHWDIAGPKLKERFGIAPGTARR